MPGESSLYRKIQVVLDLAKAVKVNSLVEFHLQIRDSGMQNFLSRRYDKKTDTFVIDISEKSIRHTVKLCSLLGLLTEDGSLSPTGRHALQAARYDQVIAVRIRQCLKREGVALQDLNDTIMRYLQGSPTVLPTCKQLWLAAGNSMSYSVFSKMLTLLAQCGGAQSSQKKIYLRIKAR